jgi:vacuolar-type H+-ATPase subunit E/Vma4
MKKERVKQIIENSKTIKNKIEELPFEEAIKTYIEILNTSLPKTKNYLISHAFLKYINENFNRFQELIDKTEKVKEELKELIRTVPFTQIAEKFGVTDNAIRKWCDLYNLPRKKSEIKKISEEDWKTI